MRRINLVFLAFLLSAVSLLAGALHVAHGIQMRRSAPALLERHRAEADRDLAKAEESLALYLNLRREDGPAWRWYARIVDRRDTDQRRAIVSTSSTWRRCGTIPATWSLGGDGGARAWISADTAMPDPT